MKNRKSSARPRERGSARTLADGDFCNVVGGTHAGKSGLVTDIKTSKTGHVTITVVQDDGVRFKSLAGT